MSLNELQNSISGMQMLTSIRNVKIGGYTLNVNRISSVLSTAVDEMIDVDGRAAAASCAISSLRLTADISSTNPIIIGRIIDAVSADNSVVIGQNLTATSPNQTILGAPSGTADENHLTWLGRTSDADKIWFGNKNLNSYISESLTDIRDINNLRDTFVVKRDSVTFYNSDNGNSTTVYPTIVSALNANADYALNHVVNFKLAEDIEMLSSAYIVVGSVKTSSRLKISNMKVVFDLNGFCVSSKCDYLMHISENAEVEVKNGKIRVDSDNGQKGFILCNGGRLKLSNVEMTMTDNGNKNIDLIRIYDHDDLENHLISFDGNVISSKSVTDEAVILSAGTLSACACRCEIDQYCKLTMNNCKNDSDICIWGFGPSPLTKLAYGEKTYANGRRLSNIRPEIIIDGQITMNASSELADTDTLYGDYTHGADSVGVKIEIGPHARINVERGHALYSSNENTQIVVNGGYIHGTNGVTMRGGTLTIPEYANPTVIGDGNYVEYDPDHTSGQAGGGLFMGHAILLETTSTSYGLISASIESGNIIGRNNSSIGSYMHAGSTQPRVTQFVSGGTLNRGTSTTETQNGVNSPDYDIVKNGYVQNYPVTIVKQDPHYNGILEQYEQRISQLEQKLAEAEQTSDEIANT